MRKRWLCLLCLAALLLPAVATLSSCGIEPVTRLYVYNWGEYMALGKYDSTDINEAFEVWYEETYGQRVEVVYSVFSSNEEMYAKMQNGSSKIDVIFPSEYMVERLIKEEMLHPLDFSLIGAYEECIEERFRELPTAPYCVPYTYGYLGLIYDESLDEVLRDEDGEISWHTLWNKIPGGTDLSGQILTFNNSRDAFGIAQFILNYEKANGEDLYVNTADTARWDEAYELLREQKNVLQAYVMDEIYNKMESGAALLAPYYAGDYFTMADVNERLCFAYPKEGTNFFYDAMCVPTASKNKDLAQIYINFLLGGTDGETLDLAIENAEYVAYSSPNIRVTSDPDYLADMVEDYGEEVLSILYPESDHEGMLELIEPYIEWRSEQEEDYDPADYPGELPTIEMFAYEDNDAPETYIYQNLDNDTLSYCNGRWEALKLESAPCNDIYIATAIIVVLLVGLAVFFTLRQRNRRRFY